MGNNVEDAAAHCGSNHCDRSPAFFKFFLMDLPPLPITTVTSWTEYLVHHRRQLEDPTDASRLEDAWRTVQVNTVRRPTAAVLVLSASPLTRSLVSIALQKFDFTVVTATSLAEASAHVALDRGTLACGLVDVFSCDELTECIQLVKHLGCPAVAFGTGGRQRPGLRLLCEAPDGAFSLTRKSLPDLTLPWTSDTGGGDDGTGSSPPGSRSGNAMKMVLSDVNLVASGGLTNAYDASRGNRIDGIEPLSIRRVFDEFHADAAFAHSFDLSAAGFLADLFLSTSTIAARVAAMHTTSNHTRIRTLLSGVTDRYFDVAKQLKMPSVKEAVDTCDAHFVNRGGGTVGQQPPSTRQAGSGSTSSSSSSTSDSGSSSHHSGSDEDDDGDDVQSSRAKGQPGSQPMASPLADRKDPVSNINFADPPARATVAEATAASNGETTTIVDGPLDTNPAFAVLQGKYEYVQRTLFATQKELAQRNFQLMETQTRLRDEEGQRRELEETVYELQSKHDKQHGNDFAKERIELLHRRAMDANRIQTLEASLRNARQKAEAADKEVARLNQLSTSLTRELDATTECLKEQNLNAAKEKVAMEALITKLYKNRSSGDMKETTDQIRIVAEVKFRRRAMEKYSDAVDALRGTIAALERSNLAHYDHDAGEPRGQQQQGSRFAAANVSQSSDLSPLYKRGAAARPVQRPPVTVAARRPSTLNDGATPLVVPVEPTFARTPQVAELSLVAPVLGPAPAGRRRPSGGFATTESSQRPRRFSTAADDESRNSETPQPASVGEAAPTDAASSDMEVIDPLFSHLRRVAQQYRNEVQTNAAPLPSPRAQSTTVRRRSSVAPGSTFLLRRESLTVAPPSSGIADPSTQDRQVATTARRGKPAGRRAIAKPLSDSGDARHSEGPRSAADDLFDAVLSDDAAAIPPSTEARRASVALWGEATESERQHLRRATDDADDGAEETDAAPTPTPRSSSQRVVVVKPPPSDGSPADTATAAPMDRTAPPSDRHFGVIRVRRTKSVDYDAPFLDFAADMTLDAPTPDAARADSATEGTTPSSSRAGKDQPTAGGGAGGKPGMSELSRHQKAVNVHAKVSAALKDKHALVAASPPGHQASGMASPDGGPTDAALLTSASGASGAFGPVPTADDIEQGLKRLTTLGGRHITAAMQRVSEESAAQSARCDELHRLLLELAILSGRGFTADRQAVLKKQTDAVDRAMNDILLQPLPPVLPPTDDPSLLATCEARRVAQKFAELTRLKGCLTQELDEIQRAQGMVGSKERDALLRRYVVQHRALIHQGHRFLEAADLSSYADMYNDVASLRVQLAKFYSVPEQHALMYSDSVMDAMLLDGLASEDETAKRRIQEVKATAAEHMNAMMARRPREAFHALLRSQAPSALNDCLTRSMDLVSQLTLAASSSMTVATPTPPPPPDASRGPAAAINATGIVQVLAHARDELAALAKASTTAVNRRIEYFESREANSRAEMAKRGMDLRMFNEAIDFGFLKRLTAPDGYHQLTPGALHELCMVHHKHLLRLLRALKDRSPLTNLKLIDALLTDRRTGGGAASPTAGAGSGGTGPPPPANVPYLIACDTAMVARFADYYAEETEGQRRLAKAKYRKLVNTLKITVAMQTDTVTVSSASGEGVARQVTDGQSASALPPVGGAQSSTPGPLRLVASPDADDVFAEMLGAGGSHGVPRLRTVGATPFLNDVNRRKQLSLDARGIARRVVTTVGESEIATTPMIVAARTFAMGSKLCHTALTTAHTGDLRAASRGQDVAQRICDSRSASRSHAASRDGRPLPLTARLPPPATSV